MAANNQRDDVIQQWVSDVKNFSSEYSANWGARNVVGPPTVYPRYGDIQGAWAHRQAQTNTEFIELEFPREVFIEEMDIYETYHCGAVVEIYSKTEGGGWHQIYKVNQPQVIEHSRIFKPDIQKAPFRSREVKLVLDCAAAGGWCEIDAVQIRGTIHHSQQPPGPEKLASQLSTLVNNELFHDVTFSVDGQKVRGHKAILVARSPYFEAMFCDGMKESFQKEIVIPDISADAFINIMHFIYTHDVKDTTSVTVLTELARASDRFSLKDLQLLCNHRLTRIIDNSNVIPMYREATEKLPVLDVIKEACVYHMSLNMKELSQLPDFCALPQAVMLDIIQQSTAKLSIK